MHELHAWRLSQNKAIATAHIVTSDNSLAKFIVQARLINECLHAYGIHSTTLQPELAASVDASTIGESQFLRRRFPPSSACGITCGDLCEPLQCCR